jgi:glycosyltransferase involved in cell wall biosynthesis
MRVIIATPLGRGGKGGIDRIMDEVAVELTHHPITGLHHRFLVTRGQRSAGFSAVQLPLALAQLAALWTAGRADLVHINLSTHGSTSRKLILAAACRRLGIPYILHVHGSRMRQYWLGASTRRQGQIVKMFARAARVLVLGEIWRRFVAEQVPAAKGRIMVLPNATRAACLSHMPDPTVRILFLGRVGERKGVPQLIDALARLPRDGRWRATIAGDGDIDVARDRIVAAGLSAKVALPGWVGPEDVQRALANADILVLPSFDENLPMSVIEGMAAGLAVVATPVGATEEIIPAGDVTALTNALRLLVENKEVRDRLGAAAQSYHAQHLEISSYVQRLSTIWNATVDERIVK